MKHRQQQNNDSLRLVVGKGSRRSRKTVVSILLILCCLRIVLFLYTANLLQYPNIESAQLLQLQSYYSDRTSAEDGLDLSPAAATKTLIFDNQDYKNYQEAKQAYEFCQGQQLPVGADAQRTAQSECLKAASNFVEASLIYALVGEPKGFLDGTQQVVVLNKAEPCLNMYLQLSQDETSIDYEDSTFRELASDFYLTMGNIKMKLDALSEAHEYVRRAIQIDPTRKQAQELLSQLAKRKDDTEQLSLPNLLLLGAYESGSSVLAEWLDRGGVCHAQKYSTEQDYLKLEPHFFDNVDGRYKEGVEFYAKRFKSCVDKEEKFIMDATASNFKYPGRVYETLAKDPKASAAYHNLKMIVVLREPKSRMLASYNVMVQKMMQYRTTHNFRPKHKWYSKVATKKGRILGFNEFTHDVLQTELESGEYDYHYVDYLKKWSRMFGRKRILVLSYDELQQRPETAKWRVETFLGAKFEGELNNDFEEEELPLSATQILDPLLEAKNEELYEFMESNRGPSMEMYPFPKFDSCTETTPGFPYC